MILKNYTTLVTEARSRNSRLVIVVAQIHKIAPGATTCNDTTVYNRAQALITAVPAWATTGRPMLFAVSTISLISSSEKVGRASPLGPAR